MLLRPGRFVFTWSRIRESNPPPWLGKPMHYRCANPAGAANIQTFFDYVLRRVCTFISFCSSDLDGN